MNFFRGYVRTKGKKAVDKFKNVDKLRGLDEVKDLNEYAGVLAQDTVLIDVDNTEAAEKLLKIVEEKDILCQVRKTDRGMHFYFMNNGAFQKCATGVPLAIGIPADVKIGLTNAYAVLKHDGKEREVIYDILEGEEYQTVPKWLNVIRTKIKLNDIAEGEGRNSKLFSYILPLQEAGFTKSEIVETLEIINRWVFDEPLSDDEFRTVTRDEAFETAITPNFYDDKTFLFEKFAQYLVDTLHIKRINGQLHFYKDGIYTDGLSKIEAEMIKVLPKLARAKRTEVLEYIGLLVQDNETVSDANLIAFKNGVYDLNTGDLRDFSPDHVITNRIGWNYVPDAHSDLVDRTFDKLACGDAQIRALLEEMAGYCFYRRNELRKAFILTGEKRNGKSTYISMIHKMLGEENTSALDLKELGDRFKTAEVFRKLANLGDDIDEDFIKDVSVFKKLVTGDRMSAERKGQDPFEFNNYAKFIFSTNKLPRVKDRSGAVLDRLIIIPFNATFSKDDPDFDPYIKYKLIKPECIEYLIKIGMEGLKRVLDRLEFTQSDKVKEELDEYHRTNNPILMFFDEVQGEDFTRESVAYWFGKYNEFCLANGITALSRVEFSRQFLNAFPDLEIYVTKINGKSVRRFRKATDGK